jgi:hypothetical protein
MSRSIATAKAGKPSTGRLLLVMALTAIFALQSYLVDTHIHDLDGDEDGIVQLLTPPAISHAVPSTPSKNTPDGSQDKCPLCQLLYGGQYLTPKLVSLLLITDVVAIVSTETQLRASFNAASHNWRGRAPPKN